MRFDCMLKRNVVRFVRFFTRLHISSLIKSCEKFDVEQNRPIYSKAQSRHPRYVKSNKPTRHTIFLTKSKKKRKTYKMYIQNKESLRKEKKTTTTLTGVVCSQRETEGNYSLPRLPVLMALTLLRWCWPARIGFAICALGPRRARFFCLTASLIRSTSYW